MNILVTGCAGFIGSNLVDKLMIDGNNFVVGADIFDDFYPKKIKENNMINFLKNPHFKFFETDIRNFEELEKIFSRFQFDAVIHLAAKAGVRQSFEHESEYFDVNVSGTENILRIMKKYKVPKIIFASSSSVYGNKQEEFLSENMTDLQPVSPYAQTKSECENKIKNYSQNYGISAVCLRFFTVYGKRQRPDLAIKKFITHIENNEEITLYGDGSTARDYTCVEDTVNGILAAVNLKTDFEIINIGTGNAIKLKDMVKLIEKELNKKAIIKYDKPRRGDVYRTCADITKAKKLLGLKNPIKFEEGLHGFVELMRAEQK